MNKNIIKNGFLILSLSIVLGLKAISNNVQAQANENIKKEITTEERQELLKETSQDENNPYKNLVYETNQHLAKLNNGLRKEITWLNTENNKKKDRLSQSELVKKAKDIDEMKGYVYREFQSTLEIIKENNFLYDDITLTLLKETNDLLELSVNNPKWENEFEHRLNLLLIKYKQRNGETIIY